MPPLRNYLAHPSRLHNLETYNDVAGCGEALMRAVGDEERLAQFRELRDALRGDALRRLAEVEERALLAEVEERALLAELPGPGVHGGDDDAEIWDREHKKLFARVMHSCWTSWDDAKKYFPDQVVQIAERWGNNNGIGPVFKE